MSGIVGISLRTDQPASEQVLARMVHHLAHRGPEEEGFALHGPLGIGHCRLRIMDVEGGQQPIWDGAKECVIAVNGEIYNHQPLRQQLQGEGVKLTTESDSEIPLHLYRQHGLEFVRHLEGMYAIALMDTRTDELIIARDPVGIKPLYIAETEKGIAIASEPGALTRTGWVDPAVNNRALPSLFNRNYVAGDETLFEGVMRVHPGEVLRIRRGEVIERFRLPLDLRPASGIDAPKALQALDMLFSEKVRSHLQSDQVPYGTFLSGGVDSSSVLLCMADVKAKIRSYTIGFESISTADERAMAEKLAQEVGALHSTIEFSERDFWQYLPQVCRAMDDLTSDPNAVPLFKLAARAHFDVKIALSGEGGDEIFAGYGRYRPQSWLKRLLRRPYQGRGAAAPFGNLFRESDRFSRFYKHEKPETAYAQDGFTRLQKRQARDIAEWLPANLLLKLDRCLMAHSVEGRVPLLDREMIAFAFSLPDNLKIRKRHGKWLLKEWLNQRHPELRAFEPKRGFTVPLHEWMERKREKLRPILQDHPALEPHMRPGAMKEWLNQPLSEKGARLLFNMVCFALWYDIHIDGKTGKWEI